MIEGRAMDQARIGYNPTKPRNKGSEPLSSRFSEIRKTLFPPTARLQDMTVAPVEPVWTKALTDKLGKFIIKLPDERDIAAKATRLIKRTSGLTPGLASMAGGKVRDLPIEFRSRIFLRTCDILAQDNMKGKLRSLLEAINKAASDLDPDFDATGLKAMRTLVASLGSGDPEVIEKCGHDLQAIVAKRSGTYGRKDVELDQATGRLGYLGRWAKSVLGDCTTDQLVAIFDGLVSDIKTARQPIHSRIAAALLDVLCPQIAGRLAGSLIKAAIKATAIGEVERFYWFLYLGLSRGSFDETFVRKTIDDVLGSGGHFPTELRQIVATVSQRNETVGRLLGERVEAHLAGN
jgi:hypothetical protein